jgi:predicted PurR-regulated permease PerM
MGIDYAVLLGLMGAMLNLIPYIGSIIATILPAIVSLTTKPPVYILFIIGLYIFVQLVDNNFIVPKIVASKVEINALVSIIIVIIGGALWGIPGMFLAIPLTAILKVIFDRIEPLKPLGFLLGDNMHKKKTIEPIKAST